MQQEQRPGGRKVQGRLGEPSGGLWSLVNEPEVQGVAARDEVGVAGRSLIPTGSVGHGRNDRKPLKVFFLIVLKYDRT